MNDERDNTKDKGKDKDNNTPCRKATASQISTLGLGERHCHEEELSKGGGKTGNHSQPLERQGESEREIKLQGTCQYSRSLRERTAAVTMATAAKTNQKEIMRQRRMMTEMKNMVQLRRRKRGGGGGGKQRKQFGNNARETPGPSTQEQNKARMKTKTTKKTPKNKNKKKEQAPAIMDLDAIPWTYSSNPNMGRNVQGGTRRILEEIEIAFEN